MFGFLAPVEGEVLRQPLGVTSVLTGQPTVVALRVGLILITTDPLIVRIEPDLEAWGRDDTEHLARLDCGTVPEEACAVSPVMVDDDPDLVEVLESSAFALEVLEDRLGLLAVLGA